MPLGILKVVCVNVQQPHDEVIMASKGTGCKGCLELVDPNDFLNRLGGSP